MTIFLEITKKFLRKEITSIRDKSVAADASAANIVVSFFGYGRNKELSGSKREHADELLMAINSLVDKKTDEESYLCLRKMIEDFKKKAWEAALRKKYNDEGKSGERIERALVLLDKIYQKLQRLYFANGCNLLQLNIDPCQYKVQLFEQMHALDEIDKRSMVILFKNDLYYLDKISRAIYKLETTEANRNTIDKLKASILKSVLLVDASMELNVNTNESYRLAEEDELMLIISLTGRTLLNIAHDDDPLNIFRYHMADYFARKIDEARKPGFVKWLSQHPQVVNNQDLTHEKERHVLERLIFCEKDLKTLNVNDVDYAITRRERVLEAIDKSSRNNKESCESHKVVANLPLSFSIFPLVSPTANVQTSINPHAGYLDEALQAAEAEIKSKVNKHHKIIPNSCINTVFETRNEEENNVSQNGTVASSSHTNTEADGEKDAEQMGDLIQLITL